MIRFKLFRKENTDTYCMGRLYVAMADDAAEPDQREDYLLCDTLEPPVRPWGMRVKGKTAVPAGIYDVALTRSPKFGRMLPILIDVPGMTGIRIHRGNTAADTKGCILPGKYVGGGRLVCSTPRELDIVRMLLDQPDEARIEIVDDFAASAESADGPCAATAPIGQLVSDEIWKRLRLMAA